MGIISKVEEIAFVLLRERKEGFHISVLLVLFFFNQTLRNVMSLRIRGSWNSLHSLRGKEGINIC